MLQDWAVGFSKTYGVVHFVLCTDFYLAVKLHSYEYIYMSREGREDGLVSDQHVRLEVISEKDSGSVDGELYFILIWKDNSDVRNGYLVL